MFQVSTPALLVRYAMASVEYSVRRVKEGQYDVTTPTGQGIRVFEDGPIHPLVNGRPSPTRFTVHEAKTYLGLREPRIHAIAAGAQMDRLQPPRF